LSIVFAIRNDPAAEKGGVDFAVDDFISAMNRSLPAGIRVAEAVKTLIPSGSKKHPNFFKLK
jgi:hypothetical protein